MHKLPDVKFTLIKDNISSKDKKRLVKALGDRKYGSMLRLQELSLNKAGISM